MLSKKERFTKEQFSALLSQEGVLVVYNELGTLKYKKGNPRFAVVTSGKNEKRAPLRNKVRRRLYTLFSQEKPGFSGILYVSKKSYGFSFEQTKRAVQELFKKASSS